MNKKPNIVAVSGGFDPVHAGHIKLFREAKKLGDKLVVILNNDNWLVKKKRFVFMREKERKTVLEAIRYIDKVVLTAHSPKPKDMSVCPELTALNPSVFANGGDRLPHNIPEYTLCEELGIKMVFGVGGGKTQSSSWLINRIKKIKPKKQ